MLNERVSAAATSAERAVPLGVRARSIVGRIANGQVAVLVIAVVVIAVATQLGNGVFLTEDNIIALLRASVSTFIIGCAVTLVFASGGIDLSVGAMFTLGAVVAGVLMGAGIPWPVSILGGLAAGAAGGAINAAMIIFAKIPPIIATLSSLYAVSGLALVITGGNPISPLPGGFDALGQASLGGIPVLILYCIVIGVIAWLLLAKRRFGYDVRAMGGNERAALANGVRVRRVKLQVYIITGVVAALAGILYAARTGTADPQAGGTDVTLQVIAAVLIGGTSLFGGTGTIAGTALGAILFAEIDNALTVIGVDPLLQNIIIGVILAVAVGGDGWRRSRRFTISGG